MPGAELQNNRHGRKGKDRSISLETSFRTEHNIIRKKVTWKKKKEMAMPL